MPNCIQMQLIIINCNPCNPTILAVYCRSTASQNHLRTIRSLRTCLYVANLLYGRPTSHAQNTCRLRVLRPGRPVFLGPIAPQRQRKPRAFSLGYRLAKRKLVTCNLTPRLVRNLGNFLQLISSTSPLHPFSKCL